MHPADARQVEDTEYVTEHPRGGEAAPRDGDHQVRLEPRGPHLLSHSPGQTVDRFVGDQLAAQLLGHVFRRGVQVMLPVVSLPDSGAGDHPGGFDDSGRFDRPYRDGLVRWLEVGRRGE
jgi:hypothetical protein